MAKLLQDYRTEVPPLVQDQAGDLSSEDLDKAIGHGADQFSRVRPRIVVADVTGTGSNDYTPPSGWIEQFSTVRSIEFPTGNVPSTLLEDGDYEIYRTPTAEKIRLLKDKPTASETFRVTFPGLHSITASTGTIGDGDFRAVCHLVAAIACRMLANRYAQLQQPTLGADVADHKSKAQEYASRARDLYAVYRQHIGADKDAQVPGASVVQDWDQNFPWGEDRLTHPRRWR